MGTLQYKSQENRAGLDTHRVFLIGAPVTTMRVRWLQMAFAILVVLVGIYCLAVQSTAPAFTIDSTQPFYLEFGRGSGWHGLNTVKIDQTGRVTLHRMLSEHQQGVIVQTWEVATIQLSPVAVAEVLDRVEANDLIALRKVYRRKNIADGTQWVLWIKQGDREKSVYFTNQFPSAITRFADQLDEILARAGLGSVAWQPAPGRESRQHERELWESIKR